jgi:DNA replication protein DnaC
MQYRDSMTELKQSMQSKNDDGDNAYQAIMAKLKNATVLLLDDMFKGKVTESDINIMYEIVNFRYLNGKPMIISTEYEIKKLLTFDEAIVSRLVEMSNGNLLKIEAKNYRMST